jgi:thiosulfate dehydrogenase
MVKKKPVLGMVLGLSIAATVAVLFSASLDSGGVSAAQAQGTQGQGRIVYNPPKPEDAPKSIKNAVMLGYHILKDTQKYAGQYVGNQLNCTDCHFNAGLTKGGQNGGLSLVGVGATYPKYRKRENYSVDLVTRTNNCFERSMNGTPLPANGKEMTAIVTYYTWISKGLPIYGKIPWLGLKHLKSSHKPDRAAGKKIFANDCARCHGGNGQGTPMAPPLWGSYSFNDGAGMRKLPNFAAFVHMNMPREDPNTSVAQAIDVAAYVTAQPRPHFQKEKPQEPA